MPETKEDLLVPCDIGAVTPELKIKGAKDQKEHTDIVATNDRTYLIAVAIHKDRSRNVMTRISCKNGIPLGGYLYDVQSDNYHVECCDYLQLGYLPVSFVINVESAGWATRIPMTESVIKKFMTDLQKRELKNFRNHFKSEDFHLEFIQMIDPN